MARLARAEVFAPDEIAIVHVMNRVVRRCFLLGTDSVTGKKFDHRKVWIETRLKRYAACFGIDLLGFAILSNHFHLILRSRPDVVATWDKTEVARRWLMLCPFRKNSHGDPEEPNEFELNTIRNNAQKLATIRLRLSDIGWWMRLLCQYIAMRANHEDQEIGRFWQSRFRAIRLLDEAAILACTAYVDLNPIRAAMSTTLEKSDFTSVQRRIQSLKQQKANARKGPAKRSKAKQKQGKETKVAARDSLADRFLAPLALDERRGELGPVVNRAGGRCSDKGFLAVSLEDYLKLLDWTARQLAKGKRGRTPEQCRPILERLELDGKSWSQLVRDFGRMFYNVAGRPQTIDLTRSRVGQHRYYVREGTRELFAASSS